MITAGQQMAGQANANKNKDVFGSIIYNVKAYGAKADGVTNDTNFIQAAINDCYSNGGGIVQLATGTHLVGSLSLKSKVTLRGNGVDVTTLKMQNALNNSVISAVVVDNAAVLDMSIDGNKANQIDCSPVTFYRCSKMWVERVRVFNSKTIGLNMSNVMDSTFVDCVVSYTDINTCVSFSQDVAGFEIGNNEIRGCIFEYGALDGLIYNNNNGIITGNIFRNNGQIVGNQAAGFYSNNKKGVVFTNNQVLNNDGNGIDLYGCSEVIVSENFVSGHSSAGIMLDLTTKSTISNNICKNNGKTPIDGSQNDGISLLGSCTDNVISFNICFDDQTPKTQNYGIQEYSTNDYNKFIGNSLRGNLTGAISITGANSVNQFN